MILPATGGSPGDLSGYMYIYIHKTEICIYICNGICLYIYIYTHIVSI